MPISKNLSLMALEILAKNLLGTQICFTFSKIATPTKITVDHQSKSVKNVLSQCSDRHTTAKQTCFSLLNIISSAIVSQFGTPILNTRFLFTVISLTRQAHMYLLRDCCMMVSFGGMKGSVLQLQDQTFGHVANSGFIFFTTSSTC